MAYITKTKKKLIHTGTLLLGITLVGLMSVIKVFNSEDSTSPTHSHESNLSLIQDVHADDTGGDGGPSPSPSPSGK